MKKDFLARQLTAEVTVGVFMVMIFLGLGYFTIILSQEPWFRSRTPLEVVFDNVMGLREGDSVVARGMPVGKVTHLELQPDGVHVVAQLDAPLAIRRDHRISIVSTSILGGRNMEVDEGTAGEPDVPLRGETPRDLIADASRILSDARHSLVQGGILTNLQDGVRDLREIVARVHRGEGLIGRLLSPDDALPNDLAAAVASLKTVSGRLERGEGTLGRLFSADDALYEDLSDSVASLRTVSGRLERGEGTLGRLFSADDALYRDLSGSVASLKAISARLEKGEGTLGRLLAANDTLYQDLSATVASAKNIAAGIENGEGLIGRLVSDENLSKQVGSLVEEFRAAVDDMRETTPVTTFMSIFFGAF